VLVLLVLVLLVLMLLLIFLHFFCTFLKSIEPLLYHAHSNLIIE